MKSNLQRLPPRPPSSGATPGTPLARVSSHVLNQGFNPINHPKVGPSTPRHPHTPRSHHHNSQPSGLTRGSSIPQTPTRSMHTPSSRHKQSPHTSGASSNGIPPPSQASQRSQVGDPNATPTKQQPFSPRGERERTAPPWDRAVSFTLKLTNDIEDYIKQLEELQQGLKRELVTSATFHSRQAIVHTQDSTKQTLIRYRVKALTTLIEGARAYQQSINDLDGMVFQIAEKAQGISYGGSGPSDGADMNKSQDGKRTFQGINTLSLLLSPTATHNRSNGLPRLDISSPGDLPQTLANREQVMAANDELLDELNDALDEPSFLSSHQQQHQQQQQQQQQQHRSLQNRQRQHPFMFSPLASSSTPRMQRGPSSQAPSHQPHTQQPPASLQQQQPMNLSRQQINRIDSQLLSTPIEQLSLDPSFILQSPPRSILKRNGGKKRLQFSDETVNRIILDPEDTTAGCFSPPFPQKINDFDKYLRYSVESNVEDRAAQQTTVSGEYSTGAHQQLHASRFDRPQGQVPTPQHLQYQPQHITPMSDSHMHGKRNYGVLQVDDFDDGLDDDMYTVETIQHPSIQQATMHTASYLTGHVHTGSEMPTPVLVSQSKAGTAHPSPLSLQTSSSQHVQPPRHHGQPFHSAFEFDYEDGDDDDAYAIPLTVHAEKPVAKQFQVEYISRKSIEVQEGKHPNSYLRKISDQVDTHSDHSQQSRGSHLSNHGKPLVFKFHDDDDDILASLEDDDDVTSFYQQQITPKHLSFEEVENVFDQSSVDIQIVNKPPSKMQNPSQKQQPSSSSSSKPSSVEPTMDDIPSQPQPSTTEVPSKPTAPPKTSASLAPSRLLKTLQSILSNHRISVSITGLPESPPISGLVCLSADNRNFLIYASSSAASTTTPISYPISLLQSSKCDVGQQGSIGQLYQPRCVVNMVFTTITASSNSMKKRASYPVHLSLTFGSAIEALILHHTLDFMRNVEPSPSC